MSILGPILFAAMIILPTYFAMMGDKDVKKIAIADSSKLFVNLLPESEYVKFSYPENTNISGLKKEVQDGKFDAVLFIPPGILNLNKAVLYSLKQIPMGTTNYISGSINNIIQDYKLSKQNISPEVLQTIKSTKTDISISTIRISEEGKEKKSSVGLNMGLGYASGLLIYMFIFIFGAQVMRGVIEEKTSRIIEVVVSSVKPFQLMMGKIVGIALVGLTQFGLWVLLTLGLVTVVQTAIMPNPGKAKTEIAASQDLMKAAPIQGVPDQQSSENSKFVKDVFSTFADANINITLILVAFVIYFLGGYLLYGALFAAVGSAVDNETDTQQFMMPITIPLLLGIFVMVHAMNNPDSSLSFWFSMIPLTSPIVMMVRIPFGVPPLELALSITILIATFLFMTWFAAKIYRVGILMYGKKVNYKEIWKWVRYHN